ncbi:YraN family protein [Catenovulum sp. 2E275]|uniref:YraN family protein n=1 Tax=Catenovulum sp. 2E275 TaxID=2980497 RepID=UPI0021CFCC63|nr:YraN family protein [Catenovulum sp. 2E275]MCU4676667.1 YraN family protein [Catenovulum sp. 2E275]
MAESPTLHLKTLLNKRLLGQDYEKAAARYLTKQGLTTLEYNFNCKLGEIDLICRENDTLVFVEVRFRKNSQYGGASASISVQKQNKVKKAAQFYLQQHNINLNHCAIRFDVVTIEGQISNLNWIKNAF